jgi:hypothetical protein
MCIPSLIFLLMLISVPESPRWLVEVNRQTDAQNVLYTVRPKPAAENELRDIKNARARTISNSVSLFSSIIAHTIIYWNCIGSIAAIFRYPCNYLLRSQHISISRFKQQ